MRVKNIVLWLVFLPLSTLAGFAGRLFGLVLESIRIYFGGHEGYWSELIPVFTSVLFFSATCIRLLPKWKKGISLTLVLVYFTLLFYLVSTLDKVPSYFFDTRFPLKYFYYGNSGILIFMIIYILFRDKKGKSYLSD